jgi:hypothetical protein
MELVPDFIHRHGIAKLLYRKDISKAAIAPISAQGLASKHNKWHKQFLTGTELTSFF